MPSEGVRVGGAATPRAPSAVCLLFIALNINKDNANDVLSFITEREGKSDRLCGVGSEFGCCGGGKEPEVWSG